MQFKVLITLILLSSIIACSSSQPYSQKSIDTRACNAMSYGDKNSDIQLMDGIYNKCMNDKKKIRKRQSDKAKNLAIIDFFFELFLPSDSDN